MSMGMQSNQATGQPQLYIQSGDYSSAQYYHQPPSATFHPTKQTAVSYPMVQSPSNTSDSSAGSDYPSLTNQNYAASSPVAYSPAGYSPISAESASYFQSSGSSQAYGHSYQSQHAQNEDSRLSSNEKS